MLWCSCYGVQHQDVAAIMPENLTFGTILSSQWLRALSREAIENLKRIYVCANRFPEDIETKYSIAQPDVSLLEVDVLIHIYVKTQFQDSFQLPSYLEIAGMEWLSFSSNKNKERVLILNY